MISMIGKVENAHKYLSDKDLLPEDKELKKNRGHTQYEISLYSTTDAIDRPPNYVPPISAYSDPNWLVEAKKNLRNILQLDNNWDGYGSPPISQQLVQHTSNFLSCLENENIPTPFIGPISGGGIQLEWHINNRELEIEFIESNVIGFLKVHEDDSLEEGEFPSNDFDCARRIIEWLMIGK